ncbi:efflux RND transporter periplasmic adaptor subunit [Marinicella gelatinilytica]|uniref:efflux RND transporter periplasmic adaptor subunit n=1 Tax=Marinicella gelatinilytica TaxID=2996017 RepID=UPI002260B7DB|nr:efflux RND transporter periplasmic adaptor subunit [Marinicella gelatinilytica]MCX7543867.1 efflux RND transporter periplasmic adaptor subunit [Marinicella gelatinilytica]
MTKQMTSLKAIIIGLILGIALSLLAFNFFNFSDHSQSTASSDTNEPLYWVAPMDPNYKRDQPGKSPMGMDLIPVYAESGESSETGPGTIKISPAVVNNLGVRTEMVNRQDIHTQIDTIGYVQYDEDLLVHIHPRVEGWIEKLYIKTAGNPVNRGQALYELYSPELVNAQEEYILTLGRNNQRLITAAENRLKSLQISNEQIKALKKSRQVKQRITFFAPQTGVVDILNVREGHYIKPGDKIMSIGSLEDVWVEAEVFERQADLLALKQKVTMTLDFLPGQEWIGEVDYIYPTLDPETRTLKVRLKFNNPDHQLKPNMFAQITIHTNPLKNVLAVPTEAVIRTGDSDRVVLALGEGKFKSIQVRLGRFYNQNAEVISGLKAGDKVVTSAQFLLDSESSKTSDFKRMQAPQDKPNRVWTAASIDAVMVDHRMISASHEPIEAWDWPAMTMDFMVSEDLDMTALKPGMRAHLQIEKTDEQAYQVIGIHIQSDGEEASTMNHSNHDMATMDHSQHEMSGEMTDKMSDETAEHETMDHSGHDMSSMDHSQHDMSMQQQSAPNNDSQSDRASDQLSEQPSDKPDDNKASDQLNDHDNHGADHD